MQKRDPVYFKYSRSQKNWFLGFYVTSGVVALDWYLTCTFSPSVMQKDPPSTPHARSTKMSAFSLGDLSYFSNYSDFLPRHDCHFQGFKNSLAVCSCDTTWKYIKKPKEDSK